MEIFANQSYFHYTLWTKGNSRMPIVDAVKACFVKYGDFSGRATRSEYWWFALAVLLGSAVTLTIAHKLYVLFSLVTLLPMIAAGARRLHDTNRSGWWQLLGLVPLGVIVVVIFLIQPSRPALIPPVPSASSRP